MSQSILLHRWCRAAVALASWAAGAAPARATLLVDPPRPITHQLFVQVVETARDDGTLPATVFGNTSQRSDIEAGIDQIWAQAGIDVEFLSPDLRYNDTFAREGELDPRPSSDLGRVLDRAESAGLLANDDSLPVFFVEISPGFGFTSETTVNGLGNIGRDGIALFVGDDLLTNQNGRDAIASVVAHEIGHNLGLKHLPDGLPNLMSPNSVSEQLSADQIQAVFQTTFRNDAVAYIPFGGTGFPQMLPPGPERYWNRNTDGVWSVDQNWIPQSAPSSGSEIAIFGQTIETDRVITLVEDVTVGAITFDNASYSYTLDGLASATLDGDDDPARINVEAGEHTIRTQLRIDAPTVVDIAAGSRLVVENALALNGYPLEVAGEGTLEILGQSAGSFGSIQASSGELTGDGAIGGNLINQAGTVQPGSDIGSLFIWGDFHQQADASLVLEIGGADNPAAYDQLLVAGDAALDGSLEVSLVAGEDGNYEPAAGDRFTLLSTLAEASRVEGQFSHVALPQLAAPLSWDLDYLSDALVLEVLAGGSPADFNGDGVVDQDDFAIWDAGYGLIHAAQPSDGDANRDGDVDGEDYLVWLSEVDFALGGGAAGLTSIPEPATATLSLLLATLFCCRFGRCCR